MPGTLIDTADIVLSKTDIGATVWGWRHGLRKDTGKDAFKNGEECSEGKYRALRDYKDGLSDYSLDTKEMMKCLQVKRIKGNERQLKADR